MEEKEKDCYNCIKRDVCGMFLNNRVRKGKYLGCDKHFMEESN